MWLGTAVLVYVLVHVKVDDPLALRPGHQAFVGEGGVLAALPGPAAWLHVVHSVHWPGLLANELVHDL